jgi:hypothetical protein
MISLRCILTSFLSTTCFASSYEPSSGWLLFLSKVKYTSSIANMYIFFFLWRCGPTRAMASSFLRFLDHTQQRITVVRTPLDEWSAPRRDLYLKTHNTHNRQTSMPTVWFEPTISAGERPQTYALDHAATGTGNMYISNANCITYTQLYSTLAITTADASAEIRTAHLLNTNKV